MEKSRRKGSSHCQQESSPAVKCSPLKNFILSKMSEITNPPKTRIDDILPEFSYTSGRILVMTYEIITPEPKPRINLLLGLKKYIKREEEATGIEKSIIETTKNLFISTI